MRVGLDADAALTFVAVPVLAVADPVGRALAETSGVVTDVGSVKGTIVAPSTTRASSAGTRWPAASSTGLDGADGTMFNGAVWVLTPSPRTADATLTVVAGSWRCSGRRWWR